MVSVYSVVYLTFPTPSFQHSTFRGFVRMLRYRSRYCINTEEETQWPAHSIVVQRRKSSTIRREVGKTDHMFSLRRKDPVQTHGLIPKFQALRRIIRENHRPSSRIRLRSAGLTSQNEMEMTRMERTMTTKIAARLQQTSRDLLARSSNGSLRRLVLRACILVSVV